jgi:hypothetical protein
VSLPAAPQGRPRRRWVSLSEAIGALALLVAGLGLWDSHNARVREDRERAAAQARAAVAPAVVLRGQVEAGGRRLRLEPVRADQVIESQTFIFPAAIRAQAVRTIGDAPIEAGWIEAGVKAAARTAAPGDAGERSVPVAVVTTVVVDGQSLTERSIYRLGYSLHRRLLFGAALELDGLALVRRGVGGDLRRAVDTLAGAPNGQAGGALS